jgi:hypothetical protein
MPRFDDTRTEEVTYRLFSIYDIDDRRVYLRFISGTDESILVAGDGNTYAVGWDLTSLTALDLKFFNENLDDFFVIQRNMLAHPSIKPKLDGWRANGLPDGRPHATVLKNKAFALRWFRLDRYAKG